MGEGVANFEGGGLTLVRGVKEKIDKILWVFWRQILYLLTFSARGRGSSLLFSFLMGGDFFPRKKQRKMRAAN